VNPNVPMFLQARAQARGRGGPQPRALDQADLDRLGYVEPLAEPVERVEKPDGMETTAVRAPERAVPKRRTSGYGKPKR
jgi:hypothetical protein